MTERADGLLNELAKKLLINLEQAVHKSGLSVAEHYAVHLGACPTVILPRASEAFEILTELGYVEALMPGCADAALAVCVPALKREYRLTRKGHTWKCANHMRITGGMRLSSHHP